MKRPKMLFAVAVAGALLSAGAAQAAEVHWSIGVSLPPIGTVISNAPVYGAPIYAPPGAVYVPPPVYAPPVAVYPAPRIYAPPVVYSPLVVYRAPPVVYRASPWGYAPRVVYQRGHRHGGEGRWH